MGFFNKEEIESIASKHNYSRQKLIFMLHEIQKLNGTNSIHENQARYLAKQIKMPLSDLYEVITFYSMFDYESKGKYVIEICNSGPCFVRNSKLIIEYVKEILGINVGETTEDNMFTLQCTSCIGGCDIAPAMKIGDEVYGNLTKEKVKEILDGYRGEEICQKH